MKDNGWKVGDMVYFLNGETFLKGKVLLVGDYWAFVSCYHEPVPYLCLSHYPDGMSKELEKRYGKKTKSKRNE